MQFQHPEFLYFLFLLIIPIIIHLFQLRKFQKTPFTNVAFLKKVILQTRKSSQLKKWLILLVRLLALACIILAFAKPFPPDGKTAAQPKEIVVYLDNSFSMQLKGKRGQLLKRAVRELLESVPSEKKFTLLTNDRAYKNTSITTLKNELMQLEYSEGSPSFATILLRAKSEFSKIPSTSKTFIAISDFQENSFEIEAVPQDGVQLEFVQLAPVNTNNISIDSVFVSDKNLGKLTITAIVSRTGKTKKIVPVALYNGTEPIAKTSVKFDENNSSKVNLTLNSPSGTIRGKILVEDQGLQYDNTFYFNINKPKRINVVALSETQNQDRFLERIYDQKTFDFLSLEKGAWDYNKIAMANTVILNGLENIPSALLPVLSQLINNNGHLIVIPPATNDLEGYGALFLHLNAPRFSTWKKEEKKITNIVFAHPLYEGVFDDRVDNFQYPTVQSSWELRGNAQPVLTFSNGEPFLAQDHNVYIFTASLAIENSNFKNSPLIVPTFYNMAKQSLKLPELYYTIGKKAMFSINARLRKDEIVSIENNRYSFVPKQQSTNKQVWITTKNRPTSAGIYEITKNGQVLQGVAYNYNRKESDLTYANVSQVDHIALFADVGALFNQQKEQTEIHGLWKWFVIFAVFFLLIELLLLKYLK